MTDSKKQAEDLKAKGNTAFTGGKFQEAADLFTQAISLDPSNHILYSNRSGAYASLKEFEKALEDANHTVKLNPSWAKGHVRKATALVYLDELDQAAAAYEEALKLDPSNENVKKEYQALKERMSAPPPSSNPIGNLFNQASIQKLLSNPKTAAYFKQPDFQAMFAEIRKDPKNISKFLSDPRMMDVLGALLSPQGGADDEAAYDSHESHESHDGGHGHSHDGGHGHSHDGGHGHSHDAHTAASESKAEPMDTSSDDADVSEEQANKRAAEKEKELGNAAYKKRDFPTALAHYSKGLELDPTNITFLTNRAAVHFETGSFEACIADCEKAVEIGREHRVDFKVIAKALARIGNAYHKQGKLEEAVLYLNKSLSEHRTPEVVEKKQKVEKELDEKKKKEYIDPAKSAEARERGNELFKKSDFVGAIKEYTEAINRNPTDARLYSNRAACYTKLLEYPLGMKDAEECIRLDPNFSKGYSRKATIQLFRKDYAGAMETYEKMAKIDDPQAKKEAEEGILRCRDLIVRVHEQEVPDSEAAQRAMEDPEIQEIMSDPVMRQILEQMSNDPRAAGVHMKNPSVAKKIQKLISAGIIKVR